MGTSASHLLDETKSNYITEQAEAVLKAITPYYRRQYSVAYFSQIQEELSQQKESLKHILKQRDAPKAGKVLYDENMFYFDGSRKWKERYVVVRSTYFLECHESFETFLKGVPPCYKLMPTGGTVVTTEEKYMAMVDKCFPDDTNNLKEEFAPPLTSMPGQFPVYLRLPYRSDPYFCFRQEALQAEFLSALSDCIRHQNQDYLKKKTCESQAFCKAFQLYRQEKGKYESWPMLIGSDVRVLANLVMEELFPFLEKDLLPHLKAKKTERKRVWFATVEAAYVLVQQHLLKGMSALKEECKTAASQQEVLIQSDMDQILCNRNFLEGKLRATVLEPAEKFCSENVHPYLASVLEEIMGPISAGFEEVRELSDSMMGKFCQDFQDSGVTDELKEALYQLSRPNLLSCYQSISLLQEKLQHLQKRFDFTNIPSLVHSTQIDLQQLMENAAYTFELLVFNAMKENPDNTGSAMEKARHRVLKQYDYDSSTVRKRIFQDALVAITLPYIKKNLAPTCKTELEGLEQYIFADYTDFVNVENVYEGILLQTLDKEVSTVVKEAANLKKHNLFTEGKDLMSRSSRSSLLSSPSTPRSPGRTAGIPKTVTPEPQAVVLAQPATPVLCNGLALGDILIVTPTSSTVEHEDKTDEKSVSDAEEAENHLAAPADQPASADSLLEVEVHPHMVEAQQAEAPAAVKTSTVSTEPARAEAPSPTETAPADPATPALTEAAATAVSKETVSVERAHVEPTIERETLSTADPSPVEVVDATETPEVCMEEESMANAPTVTEELVRGSAFALEVPPTPAVDLPIEPAQVNAVMESMASLTVSTGAEAEIEAKNITECESIPIIESNAPSSGEEPVTAPSGDTNSAEEADETFEDTKHKAFYYSSSQDASAESDSTSLDIEVTSDDAAEETAKVKTEEVKVSPVSGDEVVMTSDLEGQVTGNQSPAYSKPHEVVIKETPVESQEQAPVSPTSVSAEPTREATPAARSSSPSPRPLGCIQEIRDLVEEVIEVKELLQRYPDEIRQVEEATDENSQ
ncbi:protein Niban 1a [Aplochiton taeniatus]